MTDAHGSRTLFSSCANNIGWNGNLVEKQLASDERDDVRGTDNRAQCVAKRTKPMHLWADGVSQFSEGAQVISFEAAAA